MSWTLNLKLNFKLGYLNLHIKVWLGSAFELRTVEPYRINESIWKAYWTFVPFEPFEPFEPCSISSKFIMERLEHVHLKMKLELGLYKLKTLTIESLNLVQQVWSGSKTLHSIWTWLSWSQVLAHVSLVSLL